MIIAQRAGAGGLRLEIGNPLQVLAEARPGDAAAAFGLEFGAVVGTDQQALLAGKLQPPAAVQRQAAMRTAVDEYAVARRRGNDEVGFALGGRVGRAALLGGLGANGLRDAVWSHASSLAEASLRGVTDE